ncbi:MAG: HNH endonuclease [Kiritimatiellae bacterium]|nr:HNH endonuclease [Kiritimatiellia bacterium]
MAECIFCGKSMVGMKDQNRRKYCNRECMRLHWLSMNISDKSAMHSRARKFRKSQCEICGSALKLQVHHIDKNPMNNLPENLQTLCLACHHKIHTEIKLSTCAVCGTIFRAESHRNRSKICSAQCAKEWGRICAKRRWLKTE